MNCAVEGIININEIREYKIIDCIDIFDVINEYKNISTNNNYMNYVDKAKEDIEILSVFIKINDKNINKISKDSICIYIINFITEINFKFLINNRINDLSVKKMFSKSFIYPNIDKFNLDLYPINFELKNIDNDINYAINFIIVDKSKDLEWSNNRDLSKFTDENINNNKYSYIDINQEFT